MYELGLVGMLDCGISPRCFKDGISQSCINGSQSHEILREVQSRTTVRQRCPRMANLMADGSYSYMDRENPHTLLV